MPGGLIKRAESIILGEGKRLGKEMFTPVPHKKAPSRGAATMLDLSARMAIDTALVGQCLGAAALLCACTWPFCRQRRMILLVQAAGSAALALYFASLGSATAASTGAVSLGQLLMAALIQRRSRLAAAYAATIPASAWLIAASWHGLPSALATLGAALCSTARLQRETKSMMIMFLCAAPFWVTHNLLTGSAFGLALDALSIAGNIIGLLRLRRGTPLTPEQARPAYPMRYRAARA